MRGSPFRRYVALKCCLSRWDPAADRLPRQRAHLCAANIGAGTCVYRACPDRSAHAGKTGRAPGQQHSTLPRVGPRSHSSPRRENHRIADESCRILVRRPTHLASTTRYLAGVSPFRASLIFGNCGREWGLAKTSSKDKKRRTTPRFR